jgi:hypothetical protein
MDQSTAADRDEVTFVAEDAACPAHASAEHERQRRLTVHAKIVEQSGHGSPAPPCASDAAEGTGSRVVPFADEDAVEQMGSLVRAVEGVVASNGGRQCEAAPGAARWKADFQQDSEWREAMVLKMRQGTQVYSAEETVLIAKGLALLDNVAAGTGKVRSLKHAKTVALAWTQHDTKSGLLIGHVEATIRASPEQIIAYQMHYDSKIKRSQMSPESDVRS